MSDNADARAYPSTRTKGLTKRELFAAMAMQGLCSDGPADWLAGKAPAMAVEIADRLL